MREVTFATYLRQGPTVVITWDASPYGMGATLQIDGVFKSFFAIRIEDTDQEILQTKSGDCRGQQVWEAFTGFIALRVWSCHWQNFPTVLQIRNDNVGALTLFATLKSGSSSLSIIAREFALTLGKATCRPSLVQHIPGATNTICDTLSRRHDPSFKFELPNLLKYAKAILPPARDKGWWKSLTFDPPRLIPTTSRVAKLELRSRSPRR